jgi:tetraacyldisaccharide 4'-kinase
LIREPWFWRSQDLAARFATLLLRPAEALYALAARRAPARAAPHRAPIPVICIGNATVGGVGKTPFAMLAARLLIARGRAPHFLTRGFGGAGGPAAFASHEDARNGDEAALLARIAPTAVCADRVQGAALAVAAGADCLIMDDGFQNFGLAKDLSFLLVDAEDPCGNGRLLPAGPLREPMADAIARADAIVSVGGAPPAAIDTGIARVFVAMRRMRAAPGRVVAFCGIGNPGQFFAGLAAIGCEVVGKATYADHHSYSAADMRALREIAGRAGARLVTTEKDLARIAAADRAGVSVATLDLVVDDEAGLAAMLGAAGAPA